MWAETRMPLQCCLAVACSLLLAGCLDDLLESPFVLAPAVQQAPGSMAPTARHTLLVAGSNGVVEVDGSGHATRRSTAPALAATGHKGWLVFADAHGLHFGPPPEGRAAFTPTQDLPATGVRAIQAWCRDTLLVLDAAGLEQADPRDGTVLPWAPAPPDGLDLALGPGTPCAEALVLTPTRLLAISPHASRTLADGLVDAVAVATDHHDRIFVLAGHPRALYRLGEGDPVRIARAVQDAIDLRFGTGSLLRPDDAFMLTVDGSITYLRVPP